MNYKMVSAKQIIAKVFRDMKPDNESFVADAMNWIGEALEFIGIVTGLEKVFEDVEMENYRSALPCDLHLIGAVEHNGIRLNHGSDVRTYALPNDPNALNPYALEAVAAAFTSNVDGGNHASFTQSSSARTGNEQFYVLQPGQIQTSFESGTVRIHYMRLPMDKDHYPLVPDNQTTKEAIQWYILRQMLMGGYKHPVFSWRDADAMWESYCGKAQNDLMFPSPDKMEAFKHLWVTMVPPINHYDF